MVSRGFNAESNLKISEHTRDFLISIGVRILSFLYAGTI